MIKIQYNQNIKRQIKKIISFVFAILFILLTPISSYLQIENNAYAVTLTFEQMIDSDLFTQVIMGTSIAAGLQFSKVNDTWDYTEEFKSYVKSLGKDYHIPEDPQGPNLEDIIRQILIGTTSVVLGNGIYKGLVKINDNFWKLMKAFVDENYDVGENITNNYLYTNLPFEDNQEFTFPSDVPILYFNSIDSYGIKTNQYVVELVDHGTYKTYNHDTTQFANPFVIHGDLYNYSKHQYLGNAAAGGTYIMFQDNGNYYGLLVSTIEIADGTKLVDIPIEQEDINVTGTPGYVDNPTRDFTNVHSQQRELVIPIKTDETGLPKVDETGIYEPDTDDETWIGVTPIEIPNMDPTGTPLTEIPEMPVIENPDEQTGIMIWIGNILQIIVGQLTNIANGVRQIVANTNQMIFGTPTPAFDPVTGEQIDPETGEPIVEEPEVEAGSGTIGDGIDTTVPTDFEWGDFKHFLDIFYIFIYFIVILILILLKFLSIVFSGLPSIPANTELFTQYPTILEGVNYIKNLKVGGMSITVQQAFEYIFLIFFYIFVIKQIRKLYNSNVFESHESTKSESGISETNYGKRHSSSNDEYENIKITDYSKGR